MTGVLNALNIANFKNTVNARDIIPEVSYTYKLGSATSLWSEIYTRDFYAAAGGTASLLGDTFMGLSSTDTITVNGSADFNADVSLSTIISNIVPKTNNIYNLGSTSLLWNNIYSTTTTAQIVNNYGLGLGYTKIGVGLIAGADQIPEAKVHIKQASNTYVGLFGPGVRFESSNTNNYWDIFYNTNNDLQFAHNTINLGYLNNTGANGQLNFTGQHKCCVSDEENIEDYKDMTGLIVVSTGKYSNTIDEKTKATINESLPIVKLSHKACQKNIFGVISDAEDVNETSREYAMGIFVSISNKTPSKEDTRAVINSLGEGGIWVINQNGDLENGDYVTTSDVPGYGMRQSDDILRNYTVAKITQDCSFANLQKENIKTKEVTFEGKTYVAAFVGCTYHCG